MIFKLRNEALARDLPRVSADDKGAMDGFIEQRRLAGATLSAVSCTAGALTYSAQDGPDSDIAVLLNARPAVVQVAHDHSTVHLGAADWIVARPGSQLVLSAKEDFKVLFVELSRSFWREGEWQLVAGRHNLGINPLNAAFSGCACGIFNATQCVVAGTPDATIALMATLRMSEAFQEAFRERKAPPSLVERANAKIEEHFGDSELDAARVAAHLGVSRRQLDKVYSDTGISVSAAIWEARLVGAISALNSPAYDNLSISEIAVRHGFVNESHFSRRFKTRFGESPSALRRANRIYSVGTPMRLW